MLIDVVIPVHEKDLRTIEHCIKGIKRNVQSLRNVYIVSKASYSDNAIWFDEAKFPFSYNKIKELTNGRSVGWAYQQLLKLYSPLVIPNILSNVLIVDADTIFYKKVNFFQDGIPLYNLSKDLDLYKSEFHHETCKHIKSLLPQIVTKYPEIFNNEIKTYSQTCEKFLNKLNFATIRDRGCAKYIKSAVCHHMLFQKNIIKHLFEVVRKTEKSDCEFYEIFLKKFGNLGFVSEYNLYFYFLITFHPQNYKIRMLNYKNTSIFRPLFEMMRGKYDYCSYHSYMAKDGLLEKIANKLALN